MLDEGRGCPVARATTTCTTNVNSIMNMLVHVRSDVFHIFHTT